MKKNFDTWWEEVVQIYRGPINNSYGGMIFYAGSPSGMKPDPPHYLSDDLVEKFRNDSKVKEMYRRLWAKGKSSREAADEMY